MAPKTDNILITIVTFLANLQVAHAYTYCYGGCWYGSWYIWCAVIVLVSVCCGVLAHFCRRYRQARHAQNTRRVVVTAAAPGQNVQPSPYYYIDSSNPAAAPGPPPYQIAASMPEPEKNNPPAYSDVISGHGGYINPAGPAPGCPDASTFTTTAPQCPPGYQAQPMGYPLPTYPDPGHIATTQGSGVETVGAPPPMVTQATPSTAQQPPPYPVTSSSQ